MRNEYYMKEYRHFNGDYNIIFNLIEVNTDNNTATVAINNLGKLTQQTIELRTENDAMYFEFERTFPLRPILPPTLFACSPFHTIRDMLAARASARLSLCGNNSP